MNLSLCCNKLKANCASNVLLRLPDFFYLGKVLWLYNLLFMAKDTFPQMYILKSRFLEKVPQNAIKKNETKQTKKKKQWKLFCGDSFRTCRSITSVINNRPYLKLRMLNFGYRHLCPKNKNSDLQNGPKLIMVPHYFWKLVISFRVKTT